MKRLPVLRLDHGRPQGPLLGLPALLFGIAVALSATVMVASIRLGSNAAALQDQVQQSQQAADHAARRHRSVHRKPEAVADERLAQRIRAELALPWDRLFGALEACAGPDVSLLTLTPAPARHQLTLSGEARNLAALLDFLRRLQGNGNFAGVYLRDHHVDAADPLQPVRFSVQADWKDKP